MLTDRIEAKWIDAFAATLSLCALRPGDAVAILSETQSRRLNVDLAELALVRLGARAFHVVLPRPAPTSPSTCATRRSAACGAGATARARSRTGRAGCACAFRAPARSTAGWCSAPVTST